MTSVLIKIKSQDLKQILTQILISYLEKRTFFSPTDFLFVHSTGFYVLPIYHGPVLKKTN